MPAAKTLLFLPQTSRRAHGWVLLIRVVGPGQMMLRHQRLTDTHNQTVMQRVHAPEWGSGRDLS